MEAPWEKCVSWAGAVLNNVRSFFLSFILPHIGLISDSGSASLGEGRGSAHLL